MYWVILGHQLIDWKIGNENQLVAISEPNSRAYFSSQICIAGIAN